MKRSGICTKLLGAAAQKKHSAERNIFKPNLSEKLQVEHTLA